VSGDGPRRPVGSTPPRRAVSSAPPRRPVGSAPPRRPRTWRIALVALAVLVALNLLAAAFDAASGGRPGGPRSSTYATGGDGLAALHDLLRESGHPVERLRQRPSDGTLDPSATVVVLDPSDISTREARALRRFVEAGGRLVAGGRDPAPWLGEVVKPAPEWREGGARTLEPDAAADGPAVPETAGVHAVEAAGEGRFASTPGATPALRGLLAVADVGRGRVAMLADASPLQNRLLARADNAALGLALAGRDGRPVAFAETVHGYGEQRGLGALPGRWKWALAGLLLAAVAWVASRWRRLGPAELEARPLPPPRRAYVDAVGAALARTRRPAATAERVRAAARARVARRAGLGAEPSDEALARAAATLGLTEDEAAALTRPARDDDEDLLLAGRALARAGGGDG
jgi:hypothetical protein